jgi:hypothetical protein
VLIFVGELATSNAGVEDRHRTPVDAPKQLTSAAPLVRIRSPGMSPIAGSRRRQRAGAAGHERAGERWPDEGAELGGPLEDGVALQGAETLSAVL